MELSKYYISPSKSSSFSWQTSLFNNTVFLGCLKATRIPLIAAYRAYLRLKSLFPTFPSIQ